MVWRTRLIWFRSKKTPPQEFGHWSTFRLSDLSVGFVPRRTFDPVNLLLPRCVDADLPAPNEPVPSDDNYRHFGGGQTQTTVELAPGSHTLQLILGDHNHVPHDPPVVSEKINISVQ